MGQTPFWTWDRGMDETDKVPFLMKLTFGWVKSDNEPINKQELCQVLIRNAEN